MQLRCLKSVHFQSHAGFSLQDGDQDLARLQGLGFNV